VWSKVVRKSEWHSFADVRKTFNSVDSIGNQRYVFNLKGNEFRLVAVIKFTIGFIYIRFIGTHNEYTKIDCKEI
jgi:mRNA interferase HigB